MFIFTCYAKTKEAENVSRSMLRAEKQQPVKTLPARARAAITCRSSVRCGIRGGTDVRFSSRAALALSLLHPLHLFPAQ
jgi:hypothetical protein